MWHPANNQLNWNVFCLENEWRAPQEAVLITSWVQAAPEQETPQGPPQMFVLSQNVPGGSQEGARWWCHGKLLGAVSQIVTNQVQRLGFPIESFR